MGANPFGYSEPVWRLFTELPRAGVLAGSRVLRGTAATPANRNRLELWLRMDGERIEDARFQAYGCPATIAVGGWVCEQAIGSTLAELALIRGKDIRQALEIPEDRLHCALLGEDAIKSLAPTS